LSCPIAHVTSVCSYLEFPWTSILSECLFPSPVCSMTCVPTQLWCPNTLSAIGKPCLYEEYLGLLSTRNWFHRIPVFVGFFSVFPATQTPTGSFPLETCPKPVSSVGFSSCACFQETDHVISWILKLDLHMKSANMMRSSPDHQKLHCKLGIRLREG
jgi:hypothetical protein